MGIKGFYKLLSKYSKPRVVPIKNYEGKTLSIDASIQFYRFRIAILSSGGKNLTREDGKVISHLIGLLSKSLMLLKKGIIPMWVFDGKPPDLKMDTIKERKTIKKKAEKKLTSTPSLTEDEKIKLMKQTISIKNEHIDDTKTMFNLMGIPIVQANKDAEAQCAANEIATISDATISDDSDYFLFGGKKLIRQFVKDDIVEYHLSDILRDLDLTREELIHLSIFLGTDYAPGIKGLGTISAYELFIKVGKNVNKFLDHLKYLNAELIKEGKDIKYIIPNKYTETIQKAKEYYLYTMVVDPYKIDTTWKEPDYKGLESFLKENELKDESIRKKIDELRSLYNKHINPENDREWEIIKPKKMKKT